MVHYPAGSAPLKAGQIQFADPAAYVNNLGTYRVQTRPNKRHWLDNKPPVLKSIAALQRELHYVGNQPDTRTLIQYYPGDKTKLFLDVDTYSDTERRPQETFVEVEQTVLQPIFKFIADKTGKQLTVDELVFEAAFREVKGENGQKRWKQSFHIFFPDIAVTAKRIQDLLTHLEIPAEACDRAPYRGQYGINSLATMSVMDLV